jgi:hypothetical protein
MWMEGSTILGMAISVYEVMRGCLHRLGWWRRMDNRQCDINLGSAGCVAS